MALGTVTKPKVRAAAAAAGGPLRDFLAAADIRPGEFPPALEGRAEARVLSTVALQATTFQ